MKQSYILQQLFKSFHQPPSLSKKESSQLLKSLTTSFRKQLDRDHGDPGTEFRRDNLAPKKSSSVNNVTHTSHRRAVFDPVHPTERLFRSILNDPLFTVGNNLDHAGIKRLRTKPMDVFELAVSKGLMTIDKCHDCLMAQRRIIQESSVPTVWQGMMDSGAGFKVLKWLRSSGLAEHGRYMEEDAFFRLLAQFVVAEGLQEALWHDFMQLCSTPDVEPRTAGRVLVHIVGAELTSQGSLDGGISALKRAFSLLQHDSSTRQGILKYSARQLLYHCTTLSQQYPKPTLDNFSILESIIPQIIQPSRLYLAHLNLHHPTKPSPRKALNLIKDLPDNCYRVPQRVIALGLDTAKHLLAREQFEEAREVLKILSLSFPNRLGKTEVSELEHRKSEASSLEWLQGVGLA